VVIRPLVAAATALLMSVCACGSSGGSAAASGSASTTNTGTSNSGSATAGGSPSTSQTSGAAADPATTRAIAQAYTAFFDPKASLTTAEQNLQHGAVFKAALLAQAHNGQAQGGLSARVTTATLLSPNSASVHFDLLAAGKPLLSDTPGNAAREDGRWKVAAETFCQLVQLTGHPPAACSDPKITDLPH
jgi:hypothetical protein